MIRSVAALFAAVLSIAGCDIGNKNPIIMAGDSITAKADWSKLTGCRSVENVAIPNATAHDLLALAADVKRREPRAVFIMAGINDLSARRTPSDTARDIVRFANAVQGSSTAVYVFKTLPVTRKAEIGARVRRAVEASNDILAASGVTMLDTGELLDSGGFLRADLSRGDGMHLTAKGYATWAKSLKPLVDRYCGN